MFVVSDAIDNPKLLRWAATRGLPASNMLIDENSSVGESCSHTNSLRRLFETAHDDVLSGNLLVVSSDTLLPDGFDLKTFLSQLASPVGVICDQKPSNLILGSSLNQLSDKDKDHTKYSGESSDLYAVRYNH